MKLLSPLIIIGLLAAGGLARAEAPERAHLGGKITAFERKDSSGAAVKLAEALRGKQALVVDFWSARCPVSARYEPTLVKLAGAYSAKGVGFVSVDANYQESAEEIERVRGERSVPYPVLIDAATGELASYFGASHTPEAYVISADGTLVYHGNLDELGAALDEVLAGKPVTKADTRAFGCSIKRPQ